MMLSTVNVSPPRSRPRAVAVPYGTCRDAAGWRVVAHDLAAALTGLEQRRGERDDPVAAHRAPALVVHEQDAEVAIGGDRLGQDGPVHVSMAARLEHDRAAPAVRMLARVT